MKNWFDDSSTYERVLRYLKQCPDEEYDQLIEKVNEFWFSFAARKEKMAIDDLKERIKNAEKRTTTQHKNERMNSKNVEGREGKGGYLSTESVK